MRRIILLIVLLLGILLGSTGCSWDIVGPWGYPDNGLDLTVVDSYDGSAIVGWYVEADSPYFSHGWTNGYGKIWIPTADLDRVRVTITSPDGSLTRAKTFGLRPGPNDARWSI